MYFRSEKRIKNKMKNSLMHIKKESELMYGQCEICRKEIVLISILNKENEFCDCEE
jgi:hypothetical protein